MTTVPLIVEVIFRFIPSTLIIFAEQISNLYPDIRIIFLTA